MAIYRIRLSCVPNEGGVITLCTVSYGTIPDLFHICQNPNHEFISDSPHIFGHFLLINLNSYILEKIIFSLENL